MLSQVKLLCFIKIELIGFFPTFNCCVGFVQAWQERASNHLFLTFCTCLHTGKGLTAKFPSSVWPIGVAENVYVNPLCAGAVLLRPLWLIEWINYSKLWNAGKHKQAVPLCKTFTRVLPFWNILNKGKILIPWLVQKLLQYKVVDCKWVAFAVRQLAFGGHVTNMASTSSFPS